MEKREKRKRVVRLKARTIKNAKFVAMMMRRFVLHPWQDNQKDRRRKREKNTRPLTWTSSLGAHIVLLAAESVTTTRQRRKTRRLLGQR